FVPFEIGIRYGQADEFSLRDGLVDELLTQFIICLALELPLHRLLGVDRFGIGWAEHHQRWPPPAIECVLRHFLLLRRSLCKRHHDFKSLTLVETFFFTYADHRTRVRTV